MAGYSATPLPTKLGIKEGARIALLGAPEGFAATLGELPDGARLATRARGPFDVVVLFTKERRVLVRRLPALREAVRPAGRLWVAWPKRASKVSTDVTEDVVREVALPLGLVDTKVAAIDATWSGLLLVIRVAER